MNTVQPNNKLDIHHTPLDYLSHISLYTLLIPVIVYIIVIITNNIMHLIVDNYPKNITNKSLLLFYLYIHLLLIIIAISIFREEFDKHIKNVDLEAEVLSFLGELYVAEQNAILKLKK